MSVLGLDVGTSRVKAVRFDDAWRAVDVQAEPSEVIREAGGRREQDMDQVWAAAARVLSAVAQRSPDPVDLIAVTAQGDGCWLVDAAGRPVGRALLWNDGRAAPLIRQWSADGRLDKAFRINGCQGAPGAPHAQLAWLATHQPELLDKARTLLSCGSWIYSRLTGRLVLEASEAANPFFDASTRRYEPAILDLFGLGELARLLPPSVSGADRVAPLRADVAAALGIAAGTPVAIAPYDVPATAIGAGAVVPGAAFAVLGTTLGVGAVADNPRLDRPPNGMSLPGATPDRWLVAYATMIGTEALDWAASVLGLPDAAAVSALAETSRATDLPLVLPYLSPAGERSPFLDPSARGTITGLNIGHTRADLARAVVEGLSLVVKDCLLATGSAQRLSVCGGGAASDLWCQCIADATGLVVHRCDVEQVGALGAVLSASADTASSPSVDDAVTAAVRGGRQFLPDLSRRDHYEDRYARLVHTRTVVGTNGR